MADEHRLRRQAAFALMIVAITAIVAFIALAENGSGAVVLAQDCSVDPWSPQCHRPSFMDMINGLGHRAQSNAIRQKKVKEQLLAQERLMEKKRAEQSTKEAKKSKKATTETHDESASTLKNTKYGGVDITSKKAVDSTMAQLLKTGGKAAVQKKVAEVREQVLADSGKMFGFGKKAGYLPPPPAIKDLK